MKAKDDDARTDRYGIYPAIWVSGKDACPQKIFDELFRRFGGQGYKFAIVFDCSREEYQDPEKETPVYFLDDLRAELIEYCGTDMIRAELGRRKEGKR